MPALGDDYTATFSLKDETGEVGQVTVGIPAINVGSIVDVLADVTALKTAIDNITLGTMYQVSWGDRDTESNALPGNNAAQRESKLLVQYRDATTQQPFTVTIPTIDPADLVFLPGAGDAVAWEAGNGATADMIAFAAAFVEAVRARDTGNLVEITGMRYVGRNT